MFGNLDKFLLLTYDPGTGAIVFSPVNEDLPAPEDVGVVVNLDEILGKIYDPSVGAFRVKLAGGSALNLETDEILTVALQTDYALTAFPRGKVTITVKGGGRLSYSDVGGVTIADVAGTPTIQFGTAPPAGKTLFIDYIK